MINININIRNPWVDRFENIKNFSGRVTENKTWEVEILKTYNLFRFDLQYTVRQDHAGPSFEIGLLGWEFRVSVHDNRHWNYSTNDWEVYVYTQTDS